MKWSDKALSRHEVLGFFLVLSFVYVYPIVHADYAYIDDNWRSLLVVRDDWGEQGRILIEWLHEVFTFGGGTVNVFPLPLLFSIALLAIAMTRLTFWYFSAPFASSCLIVLPVLCNPFFLGNLTYQYDGPAMVLAVVAVIYAITCKVEKVAARCSAVALLLAVTLSLYQLTLALFVGLCIVEFYLCVKNKMAVHAILLLLCQRSAQILGGGLIYFLTAYQLSTSRRGHFARFDGHWFDEVAQKFVFSMDKISLLVVPGNAWLCVAVLAIASVGYVLFIKNILVIEGGWLGKCVVIMLCLLGVPMLVLLVPGMMLFLTERNLDARNYIAFSAVLVFLMMLNYEVLGRMHTRLRWALVVPVLFMYSFGYMYGQVIVARKEFESALAQYIAYDLISHDALRTVNKFYFIGAAVNDNWSPRGHAAMTHMPLLRYILSEYNMLLHPHFLPRFGINNVVYGAHEVFEASVNAENETPVLDRKFYSICSRGGQVFIVIKDSFGPEDYNAN
ncbi:glucosyltransferase domain-containing protein [Pseudomonas sp.]|uniref:glucosyltransferase domain-containing protein n=1 Tax=Pseudomonas sp. TaxID=306 RepID=UPI00261EB80C|nr:glucosyltransferase domain-containing protein [Pseudomonas sp.]